MVGSSRPLLLLSLLFSAAFAAEGCGGSERPRVVGPPAGEHDFPDPRAHAHGDLGGHDGHGGTLVHRFENADEWAKKLDDPARDVWQKPAEVVAAMQITPGMTVADIGAGTGYFEPYLSRAVGPQGTVLALDVEPDMVRYLGERAKREQLTNVRPALAGMDDPKLPSRGVDRVLAVDVWHHIPSRAPFAAKLVEAVKSGGKVVVVDFTLEAKHGPPVQHRLAPEVIAKELETAGFAVEIVSSTLPDQYIVVGTRR